MRLAIWILAVWLLALPPTAAEAQRTRTAQETEFLNTIDAAAQLVQSNPAEAANRLRTLMRARDFQALNSQLQASARRVFLVALLRQTPASCSEALPLSDRLTQEASQNREMRALDLTLAFWIGAACDDQRRTDNALIVIATTRPDVLTELDENAVFQSAIKSRNVEMLSHLVDGAWRPSSSSTDLSPLRLVLIRLYLRQHDLPRAREVAQSMIVSGSSGIASVVVLLVDKEFDEITTADPGMYDFDQVLDWQMRNAQSAAADPNSLSAQNSLAEALTVRNRLPEALAVVDAAIARMNAAPPETPAFTDQEMQANWTHERRANILAYMNDREAALAALQAGVEQGEGGGANVSQLLNRAADLVALNRGAEALQAIDAYDPSNASPYGQMVALRVRACALAQTGDRDGMNAVITQMRARQQDSLMQVRDAALCADNLDLAAQTLIREMQDPYERAATVVGLQQFTDDDPLTEHEREMQTRSNTLLARADVQAAINRVIRRRSFNIRRPY